jgi:hypothetical protein
MSFRKGWACCGSASGSRYVNCSFVMGPAARRLDQKVLVSTKVVIFVSFLLRIVFWNYILIVFTLENTSIRFINKVHFLAMGRELRWKSFLKSSIWFTSISYLSNRFCGINLGQFSLCLIVRFNPLRKCHVVIGRRFDLCPLRIQFGI